MSCIYKTHNPDTDGPANLYHRMNQIDCAMKKFGGSKTRIRTRSKKRLTKRKRKSRSKSRSRSRA